MNSAVSNVSGVSNASDGSGTAHQSPTLPTRFGSGRAANAGAARRGGRHRRANAGSRNYLGLLEVGKRGSKMDVVVWDETGRDKENKGEDGGDGGEGRKKDWRRESKDSLGLYDEDGFLISSPVRASD